MHESVLLQYTFTFLVLIYKSNTLNSSYDVNTFEYGVHMEGEQLAFAEKGTIPPFIPQYTHNVTHLRRDLEDHYTYLRVEYLSPMSVVLIEYEKEAQIVKFNIMFPFINIPYGILGYAVPRNYKPPPKEE